MKPGRHSLPWFGNCSRSFSRIGRARRVDPRKGPNGGGFRISPPNVRRRCRSGIQEKSEKVVTFPLLSTLPRCRAVVRVEQFTGWLHLQYSMDKSSQHIGIQGAFPLDDVPVLAVLARLVDAPARLSCGVSRARLTGPEAIGELTEADLFSKIVQTLAMPVSACPCFEEKPSTVLYSTSSEPVRGNPRGCRVYLHHQAERDGRHGGVRVAQVGSHVGASGGDSIYGAMEDGIGARKFELLVNQPNRENLPTPSQRGVDCFRAHWQADDGFPDCQRPEHERRRCRSPSLRSIRAIPRISPRICLYACSAVRGNLHPDCCALRAVGDPTAMRTRTTSIRTRHAGTIVFGGAIDVTNTGAAGIAIGNVAMTSMAIQSALPRCCRGVTPQRVRSTPLASQIRSVPSCSSRGIVGSTTRSQVLRGATRRSARLTLFYCALGIFKARTTCAGLLFLGEKFTYDSTWRYCCPNGFHLDVSSRHCVMLGASASSVFPLFPATQSGLLD